MRLHTIAPALVAVALAAALPASAQPAGPLAEFLPLLKRLRGGWDADNPPVAV
jgi:hypothetical protein